MPNNPNDLDPPAGLDPKLAALITTARDSGDVGTLATMQCGVYFKQLMEVKDTLSSEQIVDIVDCIFAVLCAAGVVDALRVAAVTIETFPAHYSQERKLALLMDEMAHAYPAILQKQAQRLYLLGETLLFPTEDSAK